MMSSPTEMTEARTERTEDDELDLLTIGRCGVDVYPFQTGIGLEDVTSFGKFLGGSPTNVAVAAARQGARSAVITEVGDDPFGRFVCREMKRLGVSDRFVARNEDYNTPVTFCEIFPPDDFPLYFYRQPKAPDLELTVSNIPIGAVRSARIFWFSVTGLSAEPSRTAHHFALDLRKGSRWTIADLDYRPMFWQDEEIASREVGRALGKANVAIGNKEECRIAVGETEPDRAADALLDRGVDIAVVKQGPLGTLAKTGQERIVMPVTPVEVCNGLGAGDAFGGSFCHALLEGFDLARAVQYASTAGAIVASRLECSTAMPTTEEIERVIAEHPDIRPVIEKR